MKITSFKVMRQRAGLTARKVSETIGVSQQAVFDWESGKYSPKFETALKVAELYGCTVEELSQKEEPHDIGRNSG